MNVWRSMAYWLYDGVGV